MFAPVVSRFHTYAVDVGAVARDYMRAVMTLPAWTEWREAALREQTDMSTPAAQRQWEYWCRRLGVPFTPGGI